MAAHVTPIVKMHANSGTSDIYPNTFVKPDPTGVGVLPCPTTVQPTAIAQTQYDHNDDDPYVTGEDVPCAEQSCRVPLLTGVGGAAAGNWLVPGASAVFPAAAPVVNAGVVAVSQETAYFKVGDDTPTTVDGELTWGDFYPQGYLVP